MAIVQWKERIARAGGDNKDRTRSRQRRFWVRVDNPRMDEIEIFDAIGIGLNAPYTDPVTGKVDAQCVLVSREAEQVERNQFYFELTYTYQRTNDQGGGGGDQGGDDPTTQPVKVSVFTWARAVRGDVAYDGADNRIAVKNSAGFPLRDVPELEQKRIGFNITGYSLSAFGKAFMDSYLGRINIDIWKGYDAYTLLVDDAYSNQMNWGEVRYYENTVKLLYDPDTWKDKFWDMGMININGQHILDKYKQRVSEPVFLNGAGLYVDPPTPNSLEFRRRKTAIFANMGFEAVVLPG